LGVLFGLFNLVNPTLFSLAFSLFVSAIVKHVHDSIESSCFH
jgi:hypothetical protein